MAAGYMKIYTRTGDGGKTTLFSCGSVSKNDPRIEFLGAIDELNSTIGVAICFVGSEELKSLLSKIQNDLFQLGADVAGGKLALEKMPRIRMEHVAELEFLIDKQEEKLGIPDKFILPGGTQASAFLHLCRAITRRAERAVVGVNESFPLNQEILSYVNRLSDLFYVLARQANREVDFKEQQPIYKYFEKELS